MLELENLRQEYKKYKLLETTVHKDPMVQFDQWLNEAVNSGVPEPNAMTLSTVSSFGQPSSRVILLKGVSSGGFVFYTNYESHKGVSIANNPNGYINFLWLELERQVRISGLIEKVSTEETTAYFHSRPRGSQIGAWVSHQSEVIASREVLEENLALMETRFKDIDVIPVPDYWGGYRLKPDTIEFWQGRPNRLHDRILYVKTGGNSWNIQRLAP